MSIYESGKQTERLKGTKKETIFQGSSGYYKKIIELNHKKCVHSAEIVKEGKEKEINK